MRNRHRRFGSETARPARGATSATGLLDTRALPQVAEPIAQYPRQVLAGLRDVRNAARFVDARRPGVVRRHGERQVAVVAVEHAAEVLDAALDVVPGQERILDPDFG